MQLLGVEPRDVHFILDFPLEDLKTLLKVEEAVMAKPNLTEDQHKALDYFEWMLAQIKQMMQDMPEESDVKPIIKRVKL
jgi:hypothetical protein